MTDVSHTKMTRARLYILVDSFENDMRRCIDRYILDHLGELEAFGSSYDKIRDRMDRDSAAGGGSISDYLYLQEAYDVLNRHRDSLPTDLSRELRHNSQSVQDLLPIRNRVMHGRPLLSGDTERATTVCHSFRARYWNSTHETLDHLVRDPTWEPSYSLEARRSDRVLHNLPLPEYDETGLIGRGSDCQRVRSLLLRRRDPMITIVGEGGIGKTAVALEIAYSILDDPASPYECILWTSLKTERLTAHGVIEIADAIRDVTGAARSLASALDDSFSGGVADLAEALEGVTTLLVIDNLETVSGAEITDLYDTLPESVTYLFTSRVGVGQFERRIPLEPLGTRDAGILFRSFARSRGIERLATLPNPAVADVVSRLRTSPLAIRWYVLAVEAGRQPADILANQEELLAFCVKSVYDELAPNARHILAMLFALERSATYDELALFAELSPDELRRSVQTLLGGSMVAVESDIENPLISRIRPTEAAVQFLRRVSPPDPLLVAGTVEKERQLRISEERRRADEHARSLAPVVVRINSDHDAPTAHLLRLALIASRQGNLNTALSNVEKARGLNPEFWEVDRVEAFILSTARHVDQASTLYRSALRKADTDEARAVTSFFFAGHLARKELRPKQAIEYAKVAHEYFRTPETAHQLGGMMVWCGDYRDGQEMLEVALEEAQGKTRLIVMTSLVESWRRWSEHLLEQEHNPLEAAHKAYAGFNLGAHDLRTGISDTRLADSILDTGTALIRASITVVSRRNRFEKQVKEVLELVVDFADLFQRCSSWRRFLAHAAKLCRSKNATADLRGLYVQLTTQAGPDSTPEGSNDVGIPMTGRVCAWRGTFGFVEHSSYPDNVFFPASVVENLNEPGEEVNLAGRAVQFVVGESDDGRRPRASRVRLITDDEASI